MIEQLDPAVFANERNYFRGKYAGLRGKMRWTLEQLDVKPARTIEGSRRTVLKLLKLRDELAHTKPVAYSGTTIHAATEEPPMMESQWIEEQTTMPKVRRYVNAVETFCEWVNGKAKGHLADPHLRRSAFGGANQAQTFSARVLSPKTRPRRKKPARRIPLP